MWNLTREGKEKFRKCNLLPIHETDEEWEYALREAQEEEEDIYERLKDELYVAREELLSVLPTRFVQYVENGTLNMPTLPKAVREDYLNWVNEAGKEFEQILDAAYEHTKAAITSLPTSVQDVFQESLHDSTIQRIVRERDTLHLYINTDGGFSTKSLIHLVFKEVEVEEAEQPIQVGQWFIYDELQKIDDGFAFRVLFECPDLEWTIKMKDLDARSYYRPALYQLLRDEERLEETALVDYIEQLNQEHHYWFITPDVTCAITSFTDTLLLENGKIEYRHNELIVTVEDERFTYEVDQYNAIDFIYSDVYEDPYAQFNEPVPTEELEQAGLSDNLELQVRAWNTMYTNPEELADIINSVLLKVELTEENEMMLSVYMNHFYKIGILTEEVIEKLKKLIDD